MGEGETTKRAKLAASAGVPMLFLFAGKLGGLITFLALGKNKDKEELYETIFEIFETFFICVLMVVAMAANDLAKIYVAALLVVVAMLGRSLYAFLAGSKNLL